MIDNTPIPFQRFYRILAAFMLIFILCTLIFACSYNAPFSSPALSNDLSTGWVDESGHPVALSNFSRENNVDFNHTKIYHHLPSVATNQMLIFYCRNMYADVYINDTLLSKDTLVTGTIYGSSPGIRWHLITLPESNAPVTICIDGYSVYLDSRGMIGDIYLGNPQAVFFHAISEHIVTFITSFFLLLIGVTLGILYVYFQYRHKFGRDLLYLSSATFFTSMWTSSESLLWQLFFGNSELFHLITYLSLLMIPTSFGLIAIYRLKGWALRYGQIYLGLSVINVFITYTLHFTGIMEFHYTITIAHGLVVVLLPLLIRIFFSYQQREVNTFSNPVVIFLITILVGGLAITIVRYKLGFFSNFSHSLILSIMCFLGCLIIYHLNMLANIFKSSAKAQMLRAMALTDHMTGLFNRAAFAEHKSAYVNALSDTVTVGIILFDINNLKTTNDTLGHEKGDQLITTISCGLKEAFSTKGNCYRMGGDEFLIVLTGDDPISDYQEGLLSFTTYLQKLNDCATLPFVLEAAHGFVYDKHLTLAEALNKADAKMYENKKILKHSKS